ncbi:MAG: ATP-binding protein [Vicinamibacterales bacterium]
MTAPARYGVATLLVLIETLGLFVIGRLLELDRAPFLLFTPSVLLAAVFAGRDAGIFATLLGIVAAEIVFAEDRQERWETLEIVRLSLFMLSGLGISVAAGYLQAQRRRAEGRAADARQRAEELAQAWAVANGHARNAERRAAELDALFDVSPMGIARASDADGSHVTVNRSLAQRLGLPASLNASMTPPAGVSAPFRTTTTDGRPLDASELPLQTAARTRRPVVDAEFAIVRDDGQTILMQAHAVPLLDEQGEARGALGVFVDVSEERRHAAEQRFLASASELLAASLDYEETLGRLPALAVPAMADWAMLDVVDADGQLTRIGAAHRDHLPSRRLTGRPMPAGDTGPTLVQIASQPQLFRQIDDTVLRSLGASEWQIDGVRPLGVTSGLVVPLTLHGATLGAFAWVRTGPRPPFDERDLALAGEVGRRAAQAVEHARLYREAQSANRVKDEFVATLSHELRTPLNALLGWTDLLRSGRLTPERQREALDAIHRTARAQAQLTNDLVDVSRVVSGKFQLAPREVEIGELVRAAANTFHLAAEAKGLKLTCDVGPGLPRIVADPDRLRQVLYNLVGNAVKFTTTGSVDVSARAAGEWITLTVRDTGIGIRPSFLPYVFERFRQADGSTTRRFGGLGLGLSIVRALVELHGGTVTAESDGEDQGATFIVRLPVAAGHRPDAEPAAARAAS